MRRISQLAYCCGHKYWRWRMRGRPWAAGHTHCCECGERLAWKRSTGTNRAASLRYYYRKRARFLQDGLNTEGRPWGRTPTLLPRLRRGHYRRYWLGAYHKRAARFVATGLTSRGTVRKINRAERPASAQEIAWRQIRETMVIPTGADYLTPAERGEL